LNRATAGIGRTRARRISGRRNVSEIDRIMLAAKREEIVARKAKENLKTSSGGSNPRPLPKLAKAEMINTREQAAKAAGAADAGNLMDMGHARNFEQ